MPVNTRSGNREEFSSESFLHRFSEAGFLWRVLLFALMFFVGADLQAQTAVPDSLGNRQRTDSSKNAAGKVQTLNDADSKSANTYRKLEQQASKRKLTRQLYSMLVSSPDAPNSSAAPQTIDEEYRQYEGKTIRDVKIKVLSPFGTDISKPDSAVKTGWIDNAANKLHVNTKYYKIRDILPFRKGETVNPLSIAEAETSLRNTGFVNDARIRIDSVPYSGEVDITVTVRDLWSVGFEVKDFSTSKMDINIFDQNFLGLGNNAYIRGIYRPESNRKFGYGFGYRYNNLLTSYTNLGGYYHDEIIGKSFEIAAERPLKTNISLFGRIAYSQSATELKHAVWDSITPTYIDNFSAAAGYAFDVFDRRDGNRLVFAAGYFEKNPEYRGVDYGADSLIYHHITNRIALAQISLYRQKYYRERLINAFGIIENIAYGYSVSVQAGYNHWTSLERKGLYASLNVSASKRFGFGNFFVQGAVASHFDRQSAYEGALNFQLRYFSPLMRLGETQLRFRYFLNANYSKRLNPVPELRNYLYFSQMSAMNIGYVNSIARGMEILKFNLENNMFTPWNVLGFKFILYSFFDLGWIRNQNAPLVSSDNLYWGLGAGLRVRNDLLVFRTIEIKLGWYPRLNQSGFDNFVNFSSSTPSVSPDFVPKYPGEIPLSF